MVPRAGVRFLGRDELRPRLSEAVAAVVMEKPEFEVEVPAAVAAAERHFLRGQELDEGRYRAGIFVARSLVFL